MRFVIVGGGPAGTEAATHAARLGVEVVLIERDIIGGAANLWDCIPSKAMIATVVRCRTERRGGDGVGDVSGHLDLDVVRRRIGAITGRLESSTERILESQQVEMVRGTGRLTGRTRWWPRPTPGSGRTWLTRSCSRPAAGRASRVGGARRPGADHPRRLPARGAPEHLVVIGSGVTGVEFVHMFSSLGSRVTLIVSREQVLPRKDPEVAAVLEEDFLARGVRLLKGRGPSPSSERRHRRGALR